MSNISDIATNFQDAVSRDPGLLMDSTRFAALARDLAPGLVFSAAYQGGVQLGAKYFNGSLIYNTASRLSLRMVRRVKLA